MPDLVSLVCPSCGGKLKVSTNATSLTCQYCGTEHMVKHDVGGAVMLEAFARCPVCGRNDKAEKVSAVIASQTHEITGTEQKTETITNAQGQQQTVVREVPFSRKQVSVLGQRLVEPAPPDPSRFPPYPPEPRKPSTGGGIPAIVTGALGLVSSLVCCVSSVLSLIAMSNPSYYSNTDPTTELLAYVILGIVFLLGGAGLLALGIFRVVRAKKPDMNIEEQYRQQVEAVRREHERIRLEYDRSLARWRELYYCARDDCVFLPGENTSAPVAKMNEYLVKLPPTAPEK